MKNFISCLTLICAFFGASMSIHAAAKKTVDPYGFTVYIDAAPGFAGSMAAAIQKKKTPLTVVIDKANADYTLRITGLESKPESTGGKIARCLFADCIGVNGQSDASVELIDNHTSAIVWAYQVRKMLSGPMAQQSLSEAIAKHLKHFCDKGK